MDLLLIGMNFRTAPVELRERFAVSSAETPDVLRRLSCALPGVELVLLSTCNRTELYATAPEIVSNADSVFQALVEGLRARGEARKDHFYFKSGIEAVEHLLGVAAGLDSMVVGEAEILGQVKHAYSLAIEAETSGERMHPLFQHAFKTAKRVRTETDICRGRISISSIAVEFIEGIFNDFRKKTVMIVGAGETAELTLKCLLKKGVKEVLVLNRSRPKCQSLARRCGGRAVAFDSLEKCLTKADIVISSTSAPHHVIGAAAVRKAMPPRRKRPLLLVDLAVPRDIEAAAGRVPNVHLYDIDDLSKIAAENLARRHADLDMAWSLVRTSAAEMTRLFETSDFAALMRELDVKVRHIRDSELEKIFSRKIAASFSAPMRREITDLVHRTTNRLLGAARRTLRAVSKEDQWDQYARVTRELFDLHEGKAVPPKAANDET